MSVSCGKIGYDGPEQGDDSLSTNGGSGGRSVDGGAGFAGVASGSGGGASGGGAGWDAGGAGGVIVGPDAEAGFDSPADVAGETAGPDAAEAGSFCPTGMTTSGHMATPLYGGTGGMPYTDACPAGEMIVGFKGYTTTTSPIVVGWLQPICGKPSINGFAPSCRIVIVPGTTLPGRGRVGGSGPWSAMCPTNQVVVGFHGRAGFDLDQVSFECAPLVLSRNGASYQVAFGPTSALPPQGGSSGPTFQDGCSPDRVVVGTSSQAGQIVYELGLVCGVPVITP